MYKRQHLVYVCTGRSKAEMQPELWEIGLDGMIGGNGSYVAVSYTHLQTKNDL